MEKIKAHEKEILSGKVPDDLQVCSKCKGNTRAFTLHESRPRLFLIIIDCFVQQVSSLLGRWKCSLCHRTFTHYPDFAIPYKRYVKDALMPLSRKYLEEDHATYASVVRKEEDAIVYKSSDSKKYECQLAGSTVWRWLAYIGSLTEAIRRALRMIREKDPSSGIFRQIQPVKARKYRSNERKRVLQQCIRFFTAEKELGRLFSGSIFPHFGIPPA
jgi:hypothetical protein